MSAIRHYQSSGIEKLREKVRSGLKRIVFVLPTGGGKSRVAAEIIMNATKNGLRVAFVCNRIELIKQAAEGFAKLGIKCGIMQGDNTFDAGAQVVCCSVQTMVRRKFNAFGLLIHDECFTPDVEILTEYGWIRFDELEDQKVAQWDDGYVSFVPPDERIVRHHSGEMITVRSDRLIDLTMTPKHQLLVQYLHDGSIRKNAVEDERLNNQKRMFSAGSGECDELYELTPHDRLAIAYQADGSLHWQCKDGLISASFSFAKQRKIDRLLDICESGGYVVNEVKCNKNKRRFIVQGVRASKMIADIFDLQAMTVSKAKAIINEMVEWDGSKINSDSWYYSSKEKENVDFYQACCVFAGYATTKSVQIDGRKESFSDMHRLFIHKDRNYIGCQRIEKTRHSYDGLVYCVRVPSGNIVVRRNGKPLVIGNCHGTAASKAYHKVIEQHNNCLHIGLTATPWSKGMSKKYKWLNDEPLWQDVVVAASIPMLIEQGYLVDCDCYAPGEPDLTGVKVVKGDYDKTQLALASDKPKLIGDIVSHWFKLAGGKQTVVFAVNVAHSKHIVAEFVANGVDARHVDGYMTEEERRPIIDGFRNGDFMILSNCSMLAEGFDVPATSCMVMARATKSEIRFIQMAGRVLRPFDGKTHAVIIDHSGNIKRLGWPTEEREYVLDDGKPKEQKTQENLPRVCPACFAVYAKSLRKCPNCSFEPKPVPHSQEVEAGELVQLSKKATKYTMEDKQAIYSALLGHVREKGMKDGAAYYKFKDMVGHFPSNKLDKTIGPILPIVQNWITHENIKWAKSRENVFNRSI